MTSLYRKYRPEHFGELVGQEHVTTALRNAVKEGRAGHAYLFSGPRGTGKTTTARILARALNCLELGADGEPCGKCENCQSIAAGSFFDLVELDAASNNGVDAMRDLIQSVHLGLGASSRHKVYIIDEVHMLSGAAANTLLKTLEEPPAHVVFVLATTDQQRVLPTIRSRTQHFEFTLLTHEQLVGHLADILAREGVEADDAALDLVARRAAGSARDALSLLDQTIAAGAGRLDGDEVQAALGAVPFELRVGVLESAGAEDVAGVLVGVHDMLVAGHDARRVADDLLRTLRDAFLCVNAGGRVPYDGSAEEAARLTELGRAMGNVALVRAIEVLGQAIVDIRGQAVVDPRLVLEVAVVRIARREARTREETLLDRVERLERRLEGGGAPAPAPATATTTARPTGPVPAADDPADPPAADPPAADAPAADPPAAAPSTGPVLAARSRARARASEPVPAADDPEPDPASDTAVTADLDDVIRAWPEALGALKAPLRAAIQEAQPIGLDRGAIVFGAPRKRFEAINGRFRNEADAIKDALAPQLGGRPRFIVRPHDFDAPDALKPVAGAAATGSPARDPRPPEPAAEEPIDLDDLVDATDDPPADPAARLVAGLGARVVEERPRE